MKSELKIGPNERKMLKDGLDTLRKMLEERGFFLDVYPLAGSEQVAPNIDIVVIRPQGISFLVEVKSSIHSALDAHRASKNLNSTDKTLIVVPRLSSSTIDECRGLGLCAVDADGNILIMAQGLHLERFRQKARSVKPPLSGSIFTARSSRIVRALLAKYPQSCQQSELAEWTGVSAGYVSTRIQTMEKDGYLARSEGMVQLMEPDRLLSDWSQRCRSDRHLRFRYALSMASYEQGLDKLHEELNRLKIRYAFTGWSGAFLAAPYGEPESIMAYVSGTPDESLLRVLHPVESGGDVVLLVPHDEGVLQFCNGNLHKGQVVSYAQLYVDLMNMPGRASEQAEALRKKCLIFKDLNA